MPIERIVIRNSRWESGMEYVDAFGERETEGFLKCEENGFLRYLPLSKLRFVKEEGRRRK